MPAISVDKVKLPNGNYKGGWSGYRVMLDNGVIFRTNVGIKSPVNVPIIAKIKNERARVYTKDDKQYYNADGAGDFSETFQKFVPYIPVVGAGAGLAVALVRKSGFVGTIAWMTGGAIGFSFISQMFGGKNFFQLFHFGTAEAELGELGGELTEAPEMMKYIIDNTKIQGGGTVNKEALKMYLAGLPNYDLTVAYRMTRYAVENKKEPTSTEELIVQLKQYNLTKDDMDYFTKNIYPNLVKYATARRKQ